VKKITTLTLESYMSLRVRRVVGYSIVFIAIMWFLLSAGVFPAVTSFLGDTFSSEAFTTESWGMIPLMAFGLLLIPTSLDEQEEDRIRQESKNKKVSAEAQRQKREFDIRDAITGRLTVFGSMVELEQLPYPVEESERVVRTMLKEDSALRYDKFRREDRSITKVVWIARHLKV
jgi:hypothetical protein